MGPVSPPPESPEGRGDMQDAPKSPCWYVHVRPASGQGRVQGRSPVPVAAGQPSGFAAEGAADPRHPPADTTIAKATAASAPLCNAHCVDTSLSFGRMRMRSIRGEYQAPGSRRPTPLRCARASAAPAGVRSCAIRGRFSARIVVMATRAFDEAGWSHGQPRRPCAHAEWTLSTTRDRRAFGRQFRQRSLRANTEHRSCTTIRRRGWPRS